MSKISRMRSAKSVRHSRWGLVSLILIITFGTPSATVHAFEDWPQWMGPHRDNVWDADNIMERFPSGGLKPRWVTTIAGGYAGPAVAQGRVYVTDFVTDDDAKVDNFGRAAIKGSERVLCLNEADGKVVWQHSYPVTYTISYPAGPRCTPLIDEGLVYSLGAEGHLICFECDSGSIRWEKDLKTEYNTPAPLWGFSAHPLIDGPRLICVVGGKGSQTVALDKKTGREIWKAIDATEPGYSPPTMIEFAGKRQLLLANPEALNAVVPETGELIWSEPYEANNGSIIMSPLFNGKYVFLGGFNNRNLLVELGPGAKQSRTVWSDKNRHAISPVNVQPMIVDGCLIGMDQNGEMMACNFETGERLWRTSSMLGKQAVSSGSAFIVRNKDRFLLFTENGDLILAKLSKAGYEELDRTHIIDPTNNAFGRPVVWCAPAYANGNIYVRNDKQIICCSLK